MAPTILGLDIGGANLKAATADKRAVSVPFPLWKQPDKLPAALAELVARFPDADELAVTMTGELCDCFETKRDGVNAIISAVRFASGARPIHVWSTDGVFLNSEEAKRNHMKVAAANWHALATFAGGYAAQRPGVLIDVGSTTTDVIPLLHGKPQTQGKTDRERLRSSELVYTGARRTPVCALLGSSVAAEHFATAHDAYVLLGKVSESLTDLDTADGRPATRANAHARLARMVGGDAETVSIDEATSLAEEVFVKQIRLIEYAILATITHLKSVARHSAPKKRILFVISGSGEFVARELFVRDYRCPERLGSVTYSPIDLQNVHSLADLLGPAVSACAPAYAVAVLAAERRP
jgi:(4-(4-[2-(gamma-L-glutamylamino)ethyl]phenoxymethyl)furan-2-yl)methanamine synthase